MASTKKIILPRVFKDRSPDGKYSMWDNMPKISYSQITSWKSEKYKSDYVKNYIVGIPSESGIFAEYGSACGTWIESVGNSDKECHEPYQHLLSDFDRDILNEKLSYPDNAVYEDYIVLNVNNKFIIEGFADRCIYLPDKKLIVEDFKTGSIAKKKSEYLSPDYKQTKLYAYVKEKEGYEIEDCRVIMLDRKGNGSDKHPMRLTGNIEILPTPYNREEVEEFLIDVDKIVDEISDYYTHYIKLFS